MDRRQVLAVLGVGIGGLTGCLRLTNDDSAGASEGSSPTDEESTETTETQSGQPSNDGPASEVTLSEQWNAEPGIDFVWTDGGAIYFNDFNGAAEARHGSGIQWHNDATYEGFENNLGANAFAIGERHLTFGYTADVGEDGTQGSHFHTYDTVTGEEIWAFGAPSDGKHKAAAGATRVDDIVIIATDSWGAERDQEPLVVGLEATSGDVLWQTDKSTLPTSFINYIDSYGGEVYVAMLSGGVQVLDPADGSLTEVHETWSVTRSWGTGRGQIHGNALFAVSRDGVRAHQVGDGGREWSKGTGDGNVSAGPTVDNSLVVVGTDSGSIRALDRSTGDRLWDAAIDGTVGAIATSGLRVWVADRETGITAYDRTDGTLLHRSTKPVNGSDITVVDDTVILGGDQVHAYAIREE